jgi:aromatic-amino-acid transaminase
MSRLASPFRRRMAPRDPILGLNEQFNADPNPAKVNLGVGVYFDDEGKLPVLRCVAAAEKQLLAAPKAKGYLPIDGIAAYDKAVQGLVFGADSAVVEAGRVATVQALGGTGGLKVGADFLKRAQPSRQGADQRPELGKPPRAVHQRRLRGRAPTPTTTPPPAACASTPCWPRCGRAAGTIVVLHACCHNPTGCDLTPAQWDRWCASPRPAWCPSWTWPTRASAKASPKTARPCSSSWRTGMTSSSPPRSPRASRSTANGSARSAWSAPARTKAARVLSQLKIVIRTNYSNPPTFGAQVVATVLTTPELRALWEEELAGMRERIRAMRHAAGGQAAGRRRAGRPVLHHPQKGMFSYSGLAKEQMQRLRSEFGVYGVDSGRICVAALNSRNIDAVVPSRWSSVM